VWWQGKQFFLFVASFENFCIILFGACRKKEEKVNFKGKSLIAP